jgi:predicted TIM-barrel fold metal-dependent hydrolase
MITGFNPADMYAKAHIKRVLQTFPGVFSGIGEFSIHKEFVSSKIAGEVASLTNPAMDSVLDFAGEVGLAVIFHNDMDMPFAKAGATPVYLDQMKALLKRHPKTKIIWAHVGLGRIVHPVQQSGSEPISDRNPNQMKIVEDILNDPALMHVSFDISWDEVAKYIVGSPQALQNTIAIINRYPDRFLFGSDVVAPKNPEMYFAVYNMYAPLWKGLTPEASEKE